MARQEKCSYERISKVYNFKLLYETALNNDSDEYIKRVQVFVIRKSDHKVIQKIESSYGKGMVASPGFFCTSRSWITGYNKNAVVDEGDFGDIIVADFNFDGKEDFAVKTDQCITGPGTETFAFYLQNADGQFDKDTYLSSVVMNCPTEIDDKNHALTIETPVNAGRQLAIQKFTYDQGTGKWTKGKLHYKKG